MKNKLLLSLTLFVFAQNISAMEIRNINLVQQLWNANDELLNLRRLPQYPRDHNIPDYNGTDMTEQQMNQYIQAVAQAREIINQQVAQERERERQAEREQEINQARRQFLRDFIADNPVRDVDGNLARLQLNLGEQNFAIAYNEGLIPEPLRRAYYNGLENMLQENERAYQEAQERDAQAEEEIVVPERNQQREQQEENEPRDRVEAMRRAIRNNPEIQAAILDALENNNQEALVNALMQTGAFQTEQDAERQAEAILNNNPMPRANQNFQHPELQTQNNWLSNLIIFGGITAAVGFIGYKVHQFYKNYKDKKELEKQTKSKQEKTTQKMLLQ